MDKLIELLREKHGGDLTFNDGESYFLFLKDALFDVYMDEETKSLKVTIEGLNEGKTFVYHVDKSIEELI